MEDHRARIVRNTKMDSCARLSIKVLELLRIMMNVYVMEVIRGDGLTREVESSMT